jgi:hypothetical protein
MSYGIAKGQLPYRYYCVCLLLFLDIRKEMIQKHSVLQVRLNNSFTFSLWSEAIALPRNDSVTENCTLLLVPVSTSTFTSNSDVETQTSELDVPFWVYIIIGVGGASLAVLLCGIPLIIFLCRNQRHKRKWKDVLKVRQIICAVE